MPHAFAPVVVSLLDTDLYKFTMWQALLHAFPDNEAEYRFVCRNHPAYPLARLVPAVNEQLEHLCTLGFTEPELAYLGTRSYLKKHFIDFLRIFRFQMRYVQVQAVGDDLDIVIKGPQIHVMGFEIFVLAIVNELYFREFATPVVLQEGRRRLEDKILALEAGALNRRKHPLEVSEFGTRRRFSRAWQAEVVHTLAGRLPATCRGTSNVKLAMDHGLVPIGTMAHEYLQTYQAVGVQLRQFQRAALEGWVQEFRGDLGIALTDVIGMDAFLRDFDLYFAKLFDGMRHDSGDPFAWGEKAVAHYERLRINPATKRLVFSDGLDIPRALALYQQFGDRIQTNYGIGTNLTNDLGLTPLNIVLKLVSCNSQPVAKLSDAPGKTLCNDQTFLAYLRQVFEQPG